MAETGENGLIDYDSETRLALLVSPRRKMQVLPSLSFAKLRSSVKWAPSNLTPKEVVPRHELYKANRALRHKTPVSGATRRLQCFLENVGKNIQVALAENKGQINKRSRTTFQRIKRTESPTVGSPKLKQLYNRSFVKF